MVPNLVRFQKSSAVQRYPHHGYKLVKITLKVHYTDDYPQSVPELSLEPVDTEVSIEETNRLLKGLRDVVC